MAWGISSFTVQEAMYDAVLEFDGQDASLVEDNRKRLTIRRIPPDQIS